MQYLVTVQAWRDEPGFFEKESLKPRMIVINMNPYDWYNNRVWATMPEFDGYTRVNILCVVPEKTSA